MQLRGKAGEMQLARVRRAAVDNMGGPAVTNYASLLGPSDVLAAVGWNGWTQIPGLEAPGQELVSPRREGSGYIFQRRG